jgi:hypothetical protein
MYIVMYVYMTYVRMGVVIWIIYGYICSHTSTYTRVCARAPSIVSRLADGRPRVRQVLTALPSTLDPRALHAHVSLRARACTIPFLYVCPTSFVRMSMSRRFRQVALWQAETQTSQAKECCRVKSVVYRC